MSDSGDLLGEETPPHEEPKPSAAELEAAGQTALFGAPEPAAAQPAPMQPAPMQPSQTGPAKAAAAQPYRVLARKYRPQTFAELIGQDAMVQTLGNAIRRDRLAHAFLMTGVRGVGKTSTARLIAKALNCVGPDGQGGPTISPCGVCEPCVAIAEGRHIDVIEMDAASNTGVDDVREIIEAVRYAAVSARYKIYIVDEVHMLSRNAFNALLKTLEEPPAHVKFLFATTEVDKLPVTVLSRCQRFDLRRIPAALLQQHFSEICTKEGVVAEPEALALVAAAAEGSVRDGLSILDQAIAHADLEGGSTVLAARVRDMLGLADRSARRRLLQALLEGDPRTVLEEVDRQFALGVEPLALMRGLLDLVHQITVTQVTGGNEVLTGEEQAEIAGWSARLSAGQLHRLWQLLLKGHDEVRSAPDPLIAAQMALLRVLHAADLPDPGKLVKRIEELVQSGAVIAPAAASGEGSPPAGPMPSGGAGVAGVAGVEGWARLVELVDHSGNMLLASRMRLQLRVVRLERGQLVYALAPGFGEPFDAELRDGLLKATGERWQVEHVSGQAAADALPTLSEQEEAEQRSRHERMLNAPLVKAAFEAFPEARLVTEDAAETGYRKRSRNA